jgi:hypothetical protein
MVQVGTAARLDQYTEHRSQGAAKESPRAHWLHFGGQRCELSNQEVAAAAK